MNKKQITEADTDIIEQWYKDAETQTLEILPIFLSNIMNNYSHDYGTICKALGAGSVATAWAMNNHPQGGISGFQAGAVMWEFITNWDESYKDKPINLINYEYMLYPQYRHHFEKTISQSTWEWLQKEAAINLKKDNNHTNENVVMHWQSIIDGIIPFGYTLKKD